MITGYLPRLRVAIVATAAALLFLLGGGTAARADVFAPADFGPSIWSDKADYTPGEHVVLSGRNWQPGESVHIVVNDDKGSSWNRSVDVAANDAGDITDEFDLPNWFVAHYTIDATGSSGATAHGEFTDGNIKVSIAPNGPSSITTVTPLAETVYASTDCSGTPSAKDSKSLNASPGDTVGVGNTQSVKLEVPATSDQGGAFQAWTGNNPFSLVVGSGGRAICVVGFSGGGSHDYTATYAAPSTNHVPAVLAPTPASPVNEGQTATNSGTWSDADSGDTVTLSASVGTVTKSGTNASGTWSWSYPTTDGPANGQTVTITANDGHTTTSTTFALAVNNVAPTASLSAPDVVEGQSIVVALTGAADVSSTDTAAGFTYAFDCGSGYGAFGASTSTSCPTSDNGSRLVKAKVRDKDGDSTEYTRTVAVANVAPSATLSNDGPIDEGSSATVQFSSPTDPSSADTAAGFHYAFRCDNDTTQLPTTFAAAGTTASKSCSFGDNGSYVVVGRIFDKDDGFRDFTTTVVVRNVDPTATVSAPDVDEGHDIVISVTAPQDVAADLSSLQYAFDCGTGAGYGPLGSAASHSCATTDNGTRTVKAKVQDKDGGLTEYTREVTIRNVDPQATFSAPDVVEGHDVVLTLNSPQDVAADLPDLQYAFDCGTGDGYSAYAAAATAHCATSDNGSRDVKGKVKDKDGGVTAYTRTVTISNADPTATWNHPTDPVDEGDSFSLSLTDPQDVAADIGDLEYHFDCGSGTYSAWGTDHAISCPTTDNGELDVHAEVRDGDGGLTPYTAKVTVRNVAPTATLNAPDVDEGDAINVSVTNPHDVAADLPGLEYAFDCGSGYGEYHSADHTTCPTTDSGTRTVKAKIRDKDNGVTEYTAAVTVRNVAPKATWNHPAADVDEGDSFALSLTDPQDVEPDLTGLTYRFDCGSGTFGDWAAAPTATCATSDNGTLHVQAQIADKDNGVRTFDADVTVVNVPPTATIEAADVDEGHDIVVSLTGAHDSPADLATLEYAFDCGAGYGVFGPASTKHCPTTDSGTRTVKAKVRDKDGASNEYSRAVEIANVPPTAIPHFPDDVDEGHDIAFSLSDAQDVAGDLGTLKYAFDCGDGDDFGAYGDTPATTCPTTDDGVRTVRARVKDKDGGLSTYEHEVTIHNVAPTATLDAPDVDEGHAIAIDLADAKDAPGDLSTLKYAFDCGDGYGALSVDHTASCPTADNGERTIKAKVADKDGGETEYSRKVTIRNVAPTATFGHPGDHVKEGHSFDLSLTDPKDVDADLPGLKYRFDCGSGTYSGWGTDPAISCPTTDNGELTVHGQVKDKDNGISTYGETVVVENVDPTATWVHPVANVDEGDSFELSLTNPQDVAADLPGLKYRFDCGHGYGEERTDATVTCPTADNGDLDVKAKISDKDGGFTEYTGTVHVVNLAPTATFSSPAAPVDEGHSFELSLTEPKDVAADLPGLKYRFDCGHGYGDWGLGHTATCATSDNGTLHVHGQVMDKDEGVSTYDGTVTVANVDPTADFHQPATAVDEGHTFTISFTNPQDVPADLAGLEYRFDCGTGYGSFGSASSRTCSTSDNGTLHVRGEVQDKDGGHTEYAGEVTVANVAPTATLSAPDVDEGHAITVSLTDPKDVDADLPGLEYAFDCGTGAGYSAFGPASSASCPTSDNGTRSIQAKVKDKDDGVTEYHRDVTIRNVAPTATLAAPDVDEGHSIQLSVTDPQDVAADLGSLKYAFDCGTGDGFGEYDTATTASCPTTDSGTRHVRAKVRDKDGGYTILEQDVTIRNVAPTATWNHPSADVPEGTSFTLSLTAPQDVDQDLTGLEYRFDCGSGYLDWGTASLKNCPTTDDASLDVAGEIKDKDGGVTEYTAKVTVTNVAPKITSFTGTDTIAGPLVFAPSTFKTEFTDPGADTFVGDFTYSDGTPLAQHVDPFHSGDTVTHRFLTSGCSRTATVKVTDDNGGSDTASTTIKAGTGDFLPPVTNTPVTDKLKNGQVLPVKIRITDCNGVATTGLAPSIVLKRGDLTDIADNATDTIQPQSVSSADTTGVMRPADGAYIYNMKVSLPSADLGTPYTIVIYPYGGSTGPSMRHKIVATR